MNRTIKIKDIRPNPFQPRKSYDADSIKSLSQEIDKMGLWQGALRGREKDGHIELCFGHRRLEAVKRLGWKEVEVDVQKLSDEDMALQSLIENLQREGLNDADRGDGIAAYIKLRSASANLSAAQIKDEVGSLLGVSGSRISELLKIAEWDEKKKEPIREQKIAGRTAVYADRIGGSEAVKAVAKKGLGFRAMEAIGSKFAALPERTEQEKKITDKVAALG